MKEYAAWNEANHCGEPTCHRPRLVAAYYRNMRRDCPDCRILAAEVLDTPNMVRWVRAFRRAAHEEPRYWGLHNYVDANRRRTRGTRRLLRAVKGLVWFTETGGIVARHNPHRITFPESAHHAAVATRFVFRRLVAAQQARDPRLHLPVERGAAADDVGLRADRPDRPHAPRLPGGGARRSRAQAAREAAHRTGGTTPTPR